MIKKILLATDLSAFTPCLLRHSAEMAKKHNATLIVVHAVEPLGTLGHALLSAYLKPETSEAITTTGMDVMVKEIKSQVVDTLTDEYMDGEIDLLQLGDVIVKVGNPVEVILETADSSGADLIMVGSHSPGVAAQQADASMSLGTVAQKVLANAKVPVYVVPHIPLIYRNEVGQTQIPLW